MQVYIICAVLLCSPTVFGMFLPTIYNEFRNYRDNCVFKTGLTNFDVIRKLNFYDFPVDGSADEISICLLQTYRILNADASINPNIYSYYITTDHRDTSEVADLCVPKCGCVDGKKATKILKCLDSNGIIVLPNY